MRNVILIALLILLQISIARAEGGEQTHRVNGECPPDVQDIQEKTKQEYACDCCQKCKAARRPLEPDMQEDSPDGIKTNGCNDCCQKCGRPVQPAPEDIPPEIINKPRQK